MINELSLIALTGFTPVRRVAIVTSRRYGGRRVGASQIQSVPVKVVLSYGRRRNVLTLRKVSGLSGRGLPMLYLELKSAMNVGSAWFNGRFN